MPQPFLATTAGWLAGWLVGWLNQLLGDWRILARGLNSASAYVAKGVPGVWSQACGVLLSVLG